MVGETTAKSELRRAVLAARDEIPASERVRKSNLICARLLVALEPSLHVDADGGAMAGMPRSQAGGVFSGKAIAVYAAMRSEVDLGSFIRDAYAADAEVCFPCMTEPLENDRMPSDVPPETRTNVSRETFDPNQHESGVSGIAFRETPGAGQSEECCPPAQTPRLGHDVSQRPEMRFRRVLRAQYGLGAIPFLAKPMKSFPANDPALSDYPIADAADIDVVIVPLVAFDEGFNRLGYGGGNYDRFLAHVRPDAVVIGVAFSEQQVECIPLEEHDLPLPLIVSA